MTSKYKASASGQKFIARQRAPRVHGEYDGETYGAERKVQLPVGMGVIADLEGQPGAPLADLPER
ncbi:type VI secretion system contractile sheath small subunit, partial [Burkholderia pseudomallei]|uniref:type VI secretion system contractile sheath small subunit n=1 Tax=Burkholderia pseudomallei TaxID=28450 RepID=UPI000CCEE1EF